MKREELTAAFVQLGKVMVRIGKQESWSDFSLGITEEEYQALQAVVNRQFVLNGWFTKESVCNSLLALGEQLTAGQLESWTQPYAFSVQPKRVGVIMAGNLPLVGFHDFLSVLMSGHIVVAKLSSDDKTLLPALVEVLLRFLPELKERITISDGKLGPIDAMIATGSNNSMRYFESYFGKYPHIFRKNRTSVAILDGTETSAEIEALGKDIFTYFGLGCRNVSQLLIPEDFELGRFFEPVIVYADIVNHHKYANNYDYNKAIHLMNQEEILDNGFVLLKESDELFSPLAMIFYHRYKDASEIEDFLAKRKEDIQVIVGHGYTSPGEAQKPGLDDYADGVNTLAWLETL